VLVIANQASPAAKGATKAAAELLVAEHARRELRGSECLERRAGRQRRARGSVRFAGRGMERWEEQVGSAGELAGLLRSARTPRLRLGRAKGALGRSRLGAQGSWRPASLRSHPSPSARG
jgi:hypothetical protein